MRYLLYAANGRGGEATTVTFIALSFRRQKPRDDPQNNHMHNGAPCLVLGLKQVTNKGTLLHTLISTHMYTSTGCYVTICLSLSPSFYCSIEQFLPYEVAFYIVVLLEITEL